MGTQEDPFSLLQFSLPQFLGCNVGSLSLQFLLGCNVGSLSLQFLCCSLAVLLQCSPQFAGYFGRFLGCNVGILSLQFFFWLQFFVQFPCSPQHGNSQGLSL